MSTCRMLVCGVTGVLTIGEGRVARLVAGLLGARPGWQHAEGGSCCAVGLVVFEKFAHPPPACCPLSCQNKVDSTMFDRLWGRRRAAGTGKLLCTTALHNCWELDCSCAFRG